MNKDTYPEQSKNRTLRSDLGSVIDVLDAKSGLRTEKAIKASAKIALGMIATGVIFGMYNESGPKTEIAHSTGEISSDFPENTAIGVIETEIEKLAELHGIDSESVGNITNAGNLLPNTRNMQPGTAIYVTLEKKPIMGYEATASLQDDPLDLQTGSK